MGREFVEIFDEWVHTYDDSVGGEDKEYKDVFSGYNEILEAVAERAVGPVVEFGTGTGNLLEKLLNRDLQVVGIEPNEAMRNATSAKFPEAAVRDGDFLVYDSGIAPNTFVSTYAFHHLTDEEKSAAIERYAKELPKGGKVVFADTIFETAEAKEEMIRYEASRNHANLVEDLNREYYTTVPVMRKLFEAAGFTVEVVRMNSYVHLVDATKN